MFVFGYYPLVILREFFFLLLLLSQNIMWTVYFKLGKAEDDVELSPKSDDDFAGPQGSPLIVDREGSFVYPF